MADRYDYDRNYDSERDRSRDDQYRERNRSRDDERYRNARGDDRGLVQRAGDEVRSWFGDDEAARRRQRDEFRDRSDEFRRDVHDRERGFGSPDYNRDYRDRGYGYESGASRITSDRDDYGRGSSSDQQSWSSGRDYSASGYSGGSDRGGQSWTSAGSQYQQRSPYTRNQSTMGNPDWDRTSSVYSSEGWRSGVQPQRDWSSNQSNFGGSQGQWNSRGVERSHRSENDWRESGPHIGRGPRGYQRSDDRIREDICDRLTRHGRIDATDVQITVRGGEVTLDGTVDSREAKRLAEDVAESVDGVRDVTNHLKTGRGDERQSANRDASQRNPEDAGLGQPGTPSTLGLTGAAGNTATSSTTGEKKR